MQWTLTILFALLLSHNKGKQLMVVAGQKAKLWAKISQVARSAYEQQNNGKMVSMKMSNCKNKINPHHSYCITTNLFNVQSRR